MKDHFEGFKVLWEVVGAIQSVVLLIGLVYWIVELFRDGYSIYVYSSLGVALLLCCFLSSGIRSGLKAALRRARSTLTSQDARQGRRRAS